MPVDEGVGRVVRLPQDGRRRPGVFAHEAGLAEVAAAFALLAVGRGLVATPLGGAEAVIAFLALWRARDGVAWVRVRGVGFASAAAFLVAGASVAGAFGQDGPVFGVCLALLGLGRVVWVARGDRRLVGIEAAAAALWLAGGFLADGPMRVAVFAVAVAVEWAGMRGEARSGGAGFSPVLAGIGGIALALVLPAAAPRSIAALVVGGAGLVAMLGLQAGRRDAAAVAGGMVLWVAGLSLAVAAPQARMAAPAVGVMFGGPLVFLAGNAVLRREAEGRWPISHLGAAIALAMLAPASFAGIRLTVGLFEVIVLAGIGVWEGLERRPGPVRPVRPVRR